MNYEFVVPQKKTAAVRLKKIGLIAVYLLFGLLVFPLIIYALWPLAVLVPFGEWLLIFLTWKYTDTVFEVTTTAGDVTFSRIYGNRKRKVIYRGAWKQFDRLAPYTENSEEEIAAFDCDKVYGHFSSPDAENIFYAVGKDEKERLCVIYFEADETLMRTIKFYRPEAVRLPRKIEKSGNNDE